MKKKLLSILVVLAMVVAMMPMMTGVVFADGSSYVKINEQTIPNVEGLVTNDAIKSGTVTFTPANGDNPAKLTLNNATIESDGDWNNTIGASCDLEIELIGDNTVTSKCNVIIMSNNRTLSFTGNGDLFAEGVRNGIGAGTNCIMNTTGTITAKAGTYCGLTLTDGTLDIKSGKVVIYGNDDLFGAFVFNYETGNVSLAENYIAIGSTDFNETDETKMTPATFEDRRYYVGSPAAVAKTVVLKKGEYKVTFNMNGHGTQVPVQNVDMGDKVIKPENPTADGWDFAGWFTDEKCTDGNKYDFSTPVTENMTLYAKWNEKVSPEPDTPKTGDDNNMIAWVMMLVLGLIGFVSTIIYKTKKQK